jgi:hypothetical protein
MRRLILVLLAGCAIAASAGAATQGVPRGFVRHAESAYWTWFGPPDWIGSYGAYGITVTSPDGLDALDYGFSTILCETSPAAYFAHERAKLRAGINLQGTRLFNVSTVRGLGNATFRQSLQFTGRTQDGSVILGEIVLVYAVTSPPYCYASTLARYAPAARHRTSIVILRKIWELTYYSGPGACLGKEGHCDDPPRRP